MPANASGPTAAELQRAVQRVLAHFAEHHRAEVQDAVARLLAEAFSTITEANLTIAGLTSRTWPVAMARELVSAVPKIGSAVRVDPLDIRTLERQVAETIGELQPAIQARLIESLIVTTSYDAIKYVPPHRLDQQSLAFRLAYEDDTPHTSAAFRLYETAAEGYHSDTPEDRLVELILEGGPGAVAATRNPNLTRKGLSQVIATQQNNRDFVLSCPIVSQELVDRFLTADSAPYESIANASPQRLHKIIAELIQSGTHAGTHADTDARTLARFLSNPNTSFETLILAADRLDQTWRAAKCMPVICSHPNFPRERANNRIKRYLNMGDIDFAHPYNSGEFILRCAGHPQLDKRIRTQLFVKYEWEALFYLELSTQVIDLIPDSHLHHAISTFQPSDVRVFDRIAELDQQRDEKCLTEHAWLALVTDTPQGAAWAVTSPHAPDGISTRYSAEALVAVQAEIWKSTPNARITAVLPSTKWTELTVPKRRPFNYAHAVLTRPSITHEGATFTALCNEEDVEHLPGHYRDVVLGALRTNNLVAVATQHNTVCGIGIFDIGNRKTQFIKKFPNSKSGEPTLIDETLETGFQKLAEMWNRVQFEYVRSQTINPPPESPAL